MRGRVEKSERSGFPFWYLPPAVILGPSLGIKNQATQGPRNQESRILRGPESRIKDFERVGIKNHVPVTYLICRLHNMKQQINSPFSCHHRKFATPHSPANPSRFENLTAKKWDLLLLVLHSPLVSDAPQAQIFYGTLR